MLEVMCPGVVVLSRSLTMRVNARLIAVATTFMVGMGGQRGGEFVRISADSLVFQGMIQASRGNFND